MAEYLTNTEDLTTVADAIRAKSGQTGQLIYPDGFASAVAGIKKAPTGPYMDVLEYAEDEEGNHLIKKAKIYNHTRISANEFSSQPLMQELDWSDPSNSITKLEDSALNGSRLIGTTIPTTVTEVGKGCFSSAIVDTLIIPAGVKILPVNACSGIHGANSEDLVSVVLQSGLQKIETYAFNNARIGSISIPDTVTTVKDGAFSYSKLESVVLPSGITSISNSLFEHCTELTEISIPSTVVYIGEAAFANAGLTSITIPESVSSLGNGTFSECANLASIEILGSPTKIPDAFAYRTVITSFVIPSSVTQIGGMAFATANDALTEITCLATTPPYLVYQPFGNSTGFTIKVPSASVAAYKAATNWSDYADQIVGV